MRKIRLYFIILCLAVVLVGCGKEEFVFGNKEIVHLTSTPVGGVDSYMIYTTNIMIYADGTVEIYASDFVRWFGNSDIPVETFTLSQEELEQIKNLIVTHEIYELREDVGNKDGISGTDKYITVYSATSSNTTGGTSVSNRQFIRAYDGIYEIVREEVFYYLGEINQIQYDGYVEFQNRNVKITDMSDEILVEQEYINNVYANTVAKEDVTEYMVNIELDTFGTETLDKLTEKCEEKILNINIYVNDTYETSVAITEHITDGILKVPCVSDEQAQELAYRINQSLR